MHNHLAETVIARRLRAAAADASAMPYDWAEFQRRRRARSRATALVGRDRSLAVAASVVAALLVAGVAMVGSRHGHAPAFAPAATSAGAGVSPIVSYGARAGAGQDTGSDARTRAVEGWLADLPREPTVVRVGAHAAVTSLQDQIATLDDLMSAERVAGAEPSRLQALERQRAQLVSSLAQLRYAELLASSTP